QGLEQGYFGADVASIIKTSRAAARIGRRRLALRLGIFEQL
ncbi:unnamed protein product, partial [marine sediment metagenome]